MNNEITQESPVESKGNVSDMPRIRKRIFARNQNTNNNQNVNNNNFQNNEQNRTMHKRQFVNHNTKFSKNKLQVMFFGGVGKIGDNITALRYGNDILVIDCGVGFAEADMPGVDLVIPDMTWLKEHKELIKGICITHAHEDHIGSLPYFLDDVKVPVYASKLSLALIDNKLREFPKIKMKGVPVNPGHVVRIGCFTVEFIHVNHSIAGAYALAITTPVGVVFVSGDFKIDFTPKKKLRSEIETYRFYLGISIMLNILLLALSLK